MVSTSVGARGEAVALLVHEKDLPLIEAYDVEPGQARFPRSRTRRPISPALLIATQRETRQVVLDGLELAHPRVQLLPDGEILVVGTRCHRFPDGRSERNACVYGPDGKLRREFVLGDGIADVQVAPGGDIWVSYFDEGIFGNFGWGLEEVAIPIGEAGLVRFNAHGAKFWKYEAPAAWDTMADCYALNVAETATWAYYYMDFPLVRIGADGAVRGWRTAVSGAHALGVDDRRVLLVGGYPPHQERCVLADLGDDVLEDPEEFRLVLPSGEPCGGAHVVGRGPVLHAFVGSGWYEFDMRTLG